MPLVGLGLVQGAQRPHWFQENWKYFLDDKEKIIGAWGLACSSFIKEAQMRMCAETDSTGIPDVLWHGVWCCFGVGGSGLQDSIGTTARREQK